MSSWRGWCHWCRWVPGDTTRGNDAVLAWSSTSRSQVSPSSSSHARAADSLFACRAGRCCSSSRVTKSGVTPMCQSWASSLSAHAMYEVHLSEWRSTAGWAGTNFTSSAARLRRPRMSSTRPAGQEARTIGSATAPRGRGDGYGEPRFKVRDGCQAAGDATLRPPLRTDPSTGWLGGAHGVSFQPKVSAVASNAISAAVAVIGRSTAAGP